MEFRETLRSPHYLLNTRIMFLIRVFKYVVSPGKLPKLIVVPQMTKPSHVFRAACTAIPN